MPAKTNAKLWLINSILSVSKRSLITILLRYSSIILILLINLTPLRRLRIAHAKKRLVRMPLKRLSLTPLTFSLTRILLLTLCFQLCQRLSLLVQLFRVLEVELYKFPRAVSKVSFQFLSVILTLIVFLFNQVFQLVANFSTCQNFLNFKLDFFLVYNQFQSIQFYVFFFCQFKAGYIKYLIDFYMF